MRKLELVIFSFTLVAALGLLVWSIADVSKEPTVAYTAADYAKAKAAEIPNDKCATPAGYTDAEWREHMGHHPDQYAECL